MTRNAPTPRDPLLSPLAQEIGKKRPFDAPEQEAHLNVLRTASVLAAPFNRLFKQHRLSEALYNALRILRGSGSTGCACHEVGEMMIAQVPDVTRLVDRLEAMGLAERRRTTEDRRVVMVAITRKGLDLLAKLDAPVMELHRRSLGHMSRAELSELSALLAKARRTPDA